MFDKYLQPLRQHLTLRLTAALVSVVFVLTILFLVFIQFFYSRTILHTAENLQAQNHALLQNIMASRVKDYLDICYMTAIDAELRADLVRITNHYRNDLPIVYSSLRGNLQQYANFRSDVLAITAVASSSETVLYQRVFSGDASRSIWLSHPSGYLGELCKQAQSSDQLFLAVPDIQIRGRSIFHAVIGLRDYYNKKSIGTLIFTIDAKPLCENLSYNLKTLTKTVQFADPEELKNMTQAMLVLSSSQTILASPDISQVGSSFQPRPKSNLIETSLNRQGILLVSQIDQRQILSGISQFRNTMLMVIGVTLILYLVLLRLIFRKISRSLDQIRNGLDEVRHGSLLTRIEVSTEDELAEIAETFNNMVDRLRVTTAEREAQAMARIQAINLRRVAEIQTLESQINSHFLYNTLNVINYSAIKAKALDVSQQIRQLADVLRYIFSKSSRIVPLSSEITWLEQYLFLQKQRQGSQMTTEIQAEPEVMDWPIRKLLIQPFVENAIQHGLFTKKTGGLLRLKFKRFHDDRLLIIIEDNGTGMSQKKLDELRRLFATREIPDDLGVGLVNAWYRIRAYYNNQGAVYIQSAPNAGTRFLILLPRLEKKSDQPWWQPTDFGSDDAQDKYN